MQNIQSSPFNWRLMLLPFWALSLATFLLGSILTNVLLYTSVHKTPELTVNLYESMDQIKTERTSGKKPCDADCKKVLDDLDAAFSHPQWAHAYEAYRSLPPLPLRLLAPYPFGQQYNTTLLEVLAAFSPAPAERSPTDNSPIFNQERYQGKVENVQSVIAGGTSLLIQLAVATGLLWIGLIFPVLMSPAVQQRSNKAEAFSFAVWTSTKISCLCLLMATTTITAHLLSN